MIGLLPEIKTEPEQKAHIRLHLNNLFECLKQWCFTEQLGFTTEPRRFFISRESLHVSD